MQLHVQLFPVSAPARSPTLWAILSLDRSWMYSVDIIIISARVTVCVISSEARTINPRLEALSEPVKARSARWANTPYYVIH